MSAIASPQEILFPEPSPSQPDAWWSSLRHFGLLLSPAEVARLTREFNREPLSWWATEKLRRQQTRLAAGDLARNDFVAWVLDEVCELRGAPTGRWLRGASATSAYARTLMDGGNLRPTHVWKGEHGGELPVFVDASAQIVGVGRGRRVLGDVVQWLRLSGRPFALLTNTRQWRLLYAGIDFEAACEWDSELWFEDGRPGAQLQALRLLLQSALLDAGSRGDDEEARPAAAETRAPAAEAPVASPPDPVLLSAVRASRRGQSELSAVLGERVREAVELLVRAHGSQLDAEALGASGADIYRSAVRIVMRMVFVLFAESRGLLPRDNPVYESAYGLQGLIHQLEKVAHRSRGRLAHTFAAWPRVLALFRLVHEGSWHEALLLPAYGGELFAPGRADDADAVSRSLHFFESACFTRGEELVPDSVVHELLERLTRTRIRIRQGRGFRTTTVPVDFSDLSSEYIGILYEGLLDYELRTADAADPVIFLGIGNEPALPLSRLEQMDDRQIAELFKTLKETKADDEAGESNDESEGEPEAPDDAAAEDDEADEEGAAAGEENEAAADTSRERAEAWARRACVAAGLVRKLPAGAGPDKVARHEKELKEKVRSLVRRVVLPDHWYLVRWGGTRKGSGTFYTRPGLAVPTVHRTLRPLAWRPPTDDNGAPDMDAPAASWKPRLPEEILALKVCDPGCGSGSFLIASLRFLTDALYSSLFEHGRIAGDWRRPLSELLGLVAAGAAAGLDAEGLPCPPDADDFEPRTRAVLRRYVVERCLYGVDLDPLAIELARLALWIETMDRDLPFTFLDHKIKCGNSLVGAWFDQFQHYPLMAWKNREGGDKTHNVGVHFQKETRTKALKAFASGPLTEDARRFYAGRTLFSPDLLEQASGAHEQALAVLGRLHDLPVHDSAERSRVYREELLESPAWQNLKNAMDLWCACWFWPADALEHAPLPSTLASPGEATRRLGAAIAAAKRFFHWELEFPDVFRAAGSGFDAIVGNPPWDIAKPNSKEFFSNIDPLYRSYGKQEALAYQKRYFEDAAVEKNWLDYSGDFRAQSNFMSYAAFPFGDPREAESSQDRFSAGRGSGALEFHERWREARRRAPGYSDAAHAYRHQGAADLNLYKLFLEQAHALLRGDGRLGMIVPSGIYSDHGTGALRQLFLEHCRWEWLFGFENRDKIFDIDSRFKFNPLIVIKGGSTEAIRTAFMRRRLEDWEKAEGHATEYSRAQVLRFSPRSRAILEIQSPRDLEILEKIYSNSVLLGDTGPDGWGIKYTTEFHMTNDSKLFPPRPKWEAEGYRPDEYSRWLKGDWRPIATLWPELGVDPAQVVPIDPACLADIEARGADVERTPWRLRCAQPPYDSLPIPRADIPEGIILSREADAWIREDGVAGVALPLYQGRMIWLWDCAASDWVGPGSEDWTPGAMSAGRISSRYLIPYRAGSDLRLAFRDVQNATNQRTFIGALLPGMPAGNTVPYFTGDSALLQRLLMYLNSYAADRALRLKMSQNHVNLFYASEIPVAAAARSTRPQATLRIKALAAAGVWFARHWEPSAALPNKSERVAWRRHWALSAAERLRARACLEAVALTDFGLSTQTAKTLLSACDLPSTTLASRAFLATADAKGFWRVDKQRDPELRHSVLTLVALHDLESKITDASGDLSNGLDAFWDQNDGDGWGLPETLRLADYNLGCDERAQQSQLVASRLGPRFYDWQLGQSAEESWRECRLHAYNLGDNPVEHGQQPHRGICSTHPAGGDPRGVTETVDPQEKLFR